MCICVSLNVCVFVSMHVEDRGQHQASSQLISNVLRLSLNLEPTELPNELQIILKPSPQ